MKKTISILSGFILLSVIGIVFNACTKDTSSSSTTGGDPVVSEEMPLNVSIYLDLSDRLIRENIPSGNQMARDTAIVDYMVDKFIEKCLSDQILKTQNHFKVLFYPAPEDSEIETLADGLDIDMSKLEGAEKKKALKAMKENFKKNLEQIYTSTLKDQKWVGSDIWSFFSNNKVDEQCIKKGYRNVLLILTDGYLYQSNNKIQEGNAYSYILPETLSNPQFSLITKRKGLDNLEVLMLEVNPYLPTQSDKLKSALENWFKAMQVKKFVVSETDMTSNTKTVINNFLESK